MCSGKYELDCEANCAPNVPQHADNCMMICTVMCAMTTHEIKKSFHNLIMTDSSYMCSQFQTAKLALKGLHCIMLMVDAFAIVYHVYIMHIMVSASAPLWNIIIDM